MTTIFLTDGDSAVGLDRKEVEVGCASCGKPVTVLIPFIGCVYCNECMQSGGEWQDIGSEQFTPRYSSV